MKTYEEDFKIRMVQLYNVGKSVLELSREFDVNTQTLYSWIKKYNTTDQTKLNAAPQLSDVEKENIELKKRLEDAEMELDILKQAALIMGKRK